jgi:hypothetical protein
MYQWLEADLQANTKEWVICFFHQPPYSKGSHDSDDFWELLMSAMRQNALPILEQYGVDLILSGHSHVYERSKLIKGHYGFSSSFNNTTHAINTGNGNYEQGEHYELRRLSVTYTKPFRIRTFPVDEHLLLASFENSAHTRRELLFVPDLRDTAVSHRATLSNYRVVRFHTVENPHTYKTSRGRADIDADPRRTYSQPRFAVVIDRGGLGLFTKMFQALFISVAVALLTCFIKPTHVDPRFGLGVGGLFATVANAYFVGSLVPESNEFSLADIVNLLGIVTILLSLTQSTLSLHVYETLGRPALSRRFDRVGFWTTLVGFVAALALIMAAAHV